MADAAVRRNARLILARQPPACQRTECDQPDALARQHVRQPVLDFAVEHRIIFLMNQHRRAQFAQGTDSDLRLLRRVARNADVERLAAAHNLIQRAHRLFNRRFRIGTVVVEDIHIIQIHPPEALIEAGHQVFPAAPVAVRAGPHVVTRFGGDHQLVAVGLPVAQHVYTEVALRLAVGRAVVVRQIEMRDAVVKRRAQNGLLGFKRRDAAEIVPQAQRQRRKQKPAFAAAAIGHRVVSGGRGNIGHAKTSLVVKLLLQL